MQTVMHISPQHVRWSRTVSCYNYTSYYLLLTFNFFHNLLPLKLLLLTYCRGLYNTYSKSTRKGVCISPTHPSLPIKKAPISEGRCDFDRPSFQTHFGNLIQDSEFICCDKSAQTLAAMIASFDNKITKQ